MCLSHPLSITFYLTSFTKTRPTSYFSRLTNLEMRSKHPGIGANSKSSLRLAASARFQLWDDSGGWASLSATSGIGAWLPSGKWLGIPKNLAESLPTTSQCVKMCAMVKTWYMVSMGSGLPHDEYFTPLLYNGGWSSPFMGKNVWTMAYVSTCVPILWAQPRFIESIPTSFFKTTRQVVVNFNLRFVKSSLSASIFTTTPQLQQWISSIPKEV